MSDRAQVHVAGADVYFYIHVGGHEICERVAKGLTRARKAERLHQPDIVAHILRDSIVVDDAATRGYGIGSKEYESVYRTVRVRPRDEMVKVETIYEDDDDEGVYDIDEFVAAFSDEEVTQP